MVKVAASILSADFGRLGEEIADLECLGADWLHIDVMDGHFVPNISMGPVIMRGIKSDLFKDVHLMISDPGQYVQAFADAGADSITVHQETCPHLHRVIQQIKDLGCKVGVALNPGTPVASLADVIGDLDMVLIMSVNPGFSGQKFIPVALDKIKEVKAMRSDVLVQVDGGVNAETAGLCREAGADVLVSASYLLGAEDREEAMKVLRG